MHLDVLVESPVVIVRGGTAILKVKKSQEGDLQWRHHGKIVRGSEPHYTFVNPSKTELKIYNAGPEQAGIYEVFIRKRQCEIRKEIEVRILGLHCCSCLWSKTVLKGCLSRYTFYQSCRWLEEYQLS